MSICYIFKFLYPTACKNGGSIMTSTHVALSLEAQIPDGIQIWKMIYILFALIETSTCQKSLVFPKAASQMS